MKLSRQGNLKQIEFDKQYTVIPLDIKLNNTSTDVVRVKHLFGVQY